MKLKAVIVPLVLTLAIITASCAGMPPQDRPTSIEPFLGNWAGNWRSSVNPSDGGTVSVEIIADTQRSPNGAIYTAKSPQFQMNRIKGELRNGELAFITPWRAELTFALYGKDRLEVTYFNPGNQDRGIWSLSRK